MEKNFDYLKEIFIGMVAAVVAMAFVLAFCHAYSYLFVA